MKKIITIILFLQLFALRGVSQITGNVVDEKGESLIGVAVLVAGTNTGTVTDIDGNFSIKANVGDSLVFSYLSYTTQRVYVADRSPLQIQLLPVSFGLEEVIVMGYSQKTKTEISSAITVIGEDQLNDAPADDIGTLLQGKVSGVQVVNSSGEPGSAAEIRIRGISTIKPGNAEPLYVVDGIIGGSFTPDDVESITVLKDAGATGMYGARANKGVIVVTTKKAKLGKPRFEFKSSYGYNIADHGNITMMNGQEFFDDFSAELYRDYSTHKIDKIQFYQDYPPDLREKNYDWVGEVFKPAPIQQYYLAASGKANKFGYYLSGTYFKEGGTYRSTGFDKINLRANTDLQLSSRLNLKNNINISTSKGSTYDYLDMYYSYLGVPWDNPYDEDGNPVYVDSHNHDWWSRDHINPLHSIDNSDYNFKGVDVNYDMILGITLTDWLSFSSSNRLSFATDKGHRFVSPLAAGTFHDKGYVFESQNMWYGAISTNLFHFSKDFGSHNIDGLVGGEFNKSRWEGMNLEGKGLPEGFSVPTTASSEYKIGGSHDRELFRSFISQVNYNFNQTYFLTASYRIDATSNFPAGGRTAHFPSISASWMLSKMPFLKHVKTVDLLKLRASFGITGDPEIGASRYLGLYSLNTQYNGHSSATPYQLANPDLTWEKTNQYNVGFDVELFDERVNFTTDFYNNVTNDLLVLVAQPLSQGFEYRWENAGTVTNRGVELSLSTVNFKTKNFTWTTDFTFAKNNNKLSGIARPFYTTIGGISQIYRNDNEIYTFVLPKWLGVDPDTGGPLWEKIERDDDGNIISREPTSDYSEAEPQEVGHALPDFSGGMATMFRYKGISLAATLAYQYGNDIYNFTRVFMDNDGHEPYYNNMKPKADWSRWHQPGDVATHPSMQNNALSKEPSSRYLEDGSFIKLRTVSLSYSLPKSWIKRLKLRDVSIGVSANNLMTFTGFWGQDPEVTLKQEAWAMPGVSDFKYPNNRRYLVSLNLKF